MEGVAPSPRTLPLLLSLYALAAFCLLIFLFSGRTADMLAVLLLPTNSYAIVFILLGVYVLFQRLPLIRRHTQGSNPLGFALILSGLTFYFLADFGLFIKLLYPSLVLITFGIIILVIGRGVTLQFVAPFLVFMFASPVSDYITIQLSIALQNLSSTLGTAMLRAMGVAVLQTGNIIDLGVHQLQVAEACSGLRYLLPLLFLALCLVWLARTPLWAKIATLACVVPVAVGMNSFRITLTGLLVETRGVRAADGLMHFFEGWVLFVLAAVCLVGVLVLMTRLARGPIRFDALLDFDRIEGRHLVGPRQRAGHAWPPVVTGSMLLGLAMLAGYAALAPTIVTREWSIPDRPSLAGFPIRFGEYSGIPQPVDEEVVETLGATDHLYVDYVDGAGEQINLWVAYNEHQGDGNLLHSPRTCLPGSGWEYERLERRDIVVSGTRSNSVFPVNESIAVRGTSRIAIVYWMEARGRQVANETWNKLYTFYDSLVYRRSDGALVRVLTEVRSGETDQDALRRLYTFIDASFDYLRPYVGR